MTDQIEPEEETLGIKLPWPAATDAQVLEVLLRDEPTQYMFGKRLIVPPLPFERTYRFEHILWLSQASRPSVAVKTGRAVGKSMSTALRRVVSYDLIFASLDSSQL